MTGKAETKLDDRGWGWKRQKEPRDEKNHQQVSPIPTRHRHSEGILQKSLTAREASWLSEQRQKWTDKAEGGKEQGKPHEENHQVSPMLTKHRSSEGILQKSLTTPETSWQVEQRQNRMNKVEGRGQRKSYYKNHEKVSPMPTWHCHSKGILQKSLIAETKSWLESRDGSEWTRLIVGKDISHIMKRTTSRCHQWRLESTGETEATAGMNRSPKQSKKTHNHSVHSMKRDP